MFTHKRLHDNYDNYRVNVYKIKQ